MKNTLLPKPLIVLFAMMFLLGCKKEDTSKPTDDKPKTGHKIGEYFQGGIIFHVDSSGQHGLIISLNDLSEGVAWCAKNDTLTHANSMYDGKSNTEIIAQITGVDSSAAKLCVNYSYKGYHDWYLPSVNEWFYIFQKAGNNGYYMDDNSVKIAVNKGLLSNNGSSIKYGERYWTSTEVKAKIIGKKHAYTFRLADPQLSITYKPPYAEWDKENKFYVRAIRKF